MQLLQAIMKIIQIAAASIVRSTVGAEPNRVHIIQFKNFRRNTTTGTVDNLNFKLDFMRQHAELKLYMEMLTKVLQQFLDR
jgi:hypothetical protein